MKKIFCFFFFVALSINLYAQKTEYWKGILKTGTLVDLLITIEIHFDTDTLAFLGSPCQTEDIFKTSKIVFRNDSLLFSVKIENSIARFRGKYLSEDSIQGLFTQSISNIPLTLTKKENNIFFNRPQTPKNIDYICEEVNFFVDSVNYQFHGTLSYPNEGDNFPAVVLISGSGQQNRDEEIFHHKPFAVIADYLTRNGIAVLRYDDRGYGTFDSSLSSATTYDFANDAEAAMSLLTSHKKINPNQIGLLGHSEGGMIAPIVASRNKNVAFIILLAAPGVNGLDLLIEQNKKIMKGFGYNNKDIKNQINKLKNKDVSLGMNLPWMKYFIDFEPSKYLKQLTIPVLALNGEKDSQVISSQNLPAIKKALKKAKNKNFDIIALPNLNHCFQECTTGLPNEYFFIEQTISPQVLQLIKDFIKTYNK